MQPSNVKTFFFLLENVVLQEKSDEDKAAELLRYLEGDAFDFYYNTFSKDAAMIEAGKDY